MKFNDLSPDEVESYRLDFLLDKTFSELMEIQDQLSAEAKPVFLRKLSALFVEFSFLCYGGI